MAKKVIYLQIFTIYDPQLFHIINDGTIDLILILFLRKKESSVMKKAVKKAMSVMLLLALTLTLNAGVVGTFPQVGDGGIAPLSDVPGPGGIEY